MTQAVSTFSTSTLARRSLRFFWRTHAAIAMGIAAATAVIVGALVVGDSVRGSLRSLVLERMSNIECLLHSRNFFETALLGTLTLPESNPQASLAPAILFSNSTAESNLQGNLRRATHVQILAIDQQFLEHLAEKDAQQFPPELAEDEVAINATLAAELGIVLGQELTMRVKDRAGVPADNPLGRRDATSLSIPRQRVVAILPDAGIGGLSFQSGQAVPRNIFASLATVQDILECEQQANAILVFSDRPGQFADSVSQQWSDELNLQLRPKLEDYGLKLEHHRRVFPDPDIDVVDETTQAATAAPTVVYDYYQLSSEELILDDATSNAICGKVKFNVATRMITYLANSIAKITPTPQDLAQGRSLENEDQASEMREQRTRVLQMIQVTGIVGPEDDSLPSSSQALSREVPYSIVVGMDEGGDLEMDKYIALDRADVQIPYALVNSWLAEQLDVQPGDWIEVKYFEPETIDGKEIQRSVHLMVAGIVPLTEPVKGFRRTQPAAYQELPSLFNDPNLTPSVPGVTDQDSIANWDLPFKLELEDLILPVDDQYWNNHRLTPKLYIPYRYASRKSLFGSRFGKTTAIRIEASRVPDVGLLREQIEEALLSTRADKGLVFMPVRQRQLLAATGTTPFDMLFLSLSFFVIVAALLLVALLFKLAIQSRLAQLGILTAQGFNAGQIRSVLLREFTWVGLIGAGLGIFIGLAYARLMIAGLESWWVDAISSRFLQFGFTWRSLLLGGLVGMLASLLTIYLNLRKLRRAQPLALLRGEDPDAFRFTRKFSRFSLALAGITGLTAMGLAVLGLGQTGMAQAGSFFGSGLLLLAAMLIAVRQWTETGFDSRRSGRQTGLLDLAWRAICRNPVRSSLSVSLLAVASFLIASMSVFRVSPNERGYGGFNLIAESSQPIFRNLASAQVRREAIGPEASKLNGTSIVPLRAWQGEDASCNNLFQVSQPSILGVPSLLQETYDLAPTATPFDWAAARNRERPWDALGMSASGEGDDPIPVILDQNTAAWSLKQGSQLDAVIKLRYGTQTIYFKTVGLLSNSVLQGKLMIGEDNFQRLFPKISGYSFFLVRSGNAQSADTVATTLETGWSDVGLDVTSSSRILQRLLGVQNTYISAFQSLGALGLLLGTLGLVAVQVRSVVERRRELALMQAVGFSSTRLAKMLSIETAILLAGGVLIGILSASLALLPYVWTVGPQMSLIMPLFMLGLVLLAGMLAALFAVRAATRLPVLQNLRSE